MVEDKAGRSGQLVVAAILQQQKVIWIQNKDDGKATGFYRTFLLPTYYKLRLEVTGPDHGIGNG